MSNFLLKEKTKKGLTCYISRYRVGQLILHVIIIKTLFQPPRGRGVESTREFKNSQKIALLPSLSKFGVYDVEGFIQSLAKFGL